MPKDAQTTLIAANENPGGATTVRLPLSRFVTLMAKAYVIEIGRKEMKSA